MTDGAALAEAIAKSGYTKAYICKELGLTYTGLADKTAGRTDFKTTEVQILQRVLKLSNAERDKIFFAVNRDK